MHVICHSSWLQKIILKNEDFKKSLTKYYKARWAWSHDVDKKGFLNCSKIEDLIDSLGHSFYEMSKLLL